MRKEDIAWLARSVGVINIEPSIRWAFKKVDDEGRFLYSRAITLSQALGNKSCTSSRAHTRKLTRVKESRYCLCYPGMSRRRKNWSSKACRSGQLVVGPCVNNCSKVAKAGSVCATVHGES